MFPCLVLVSGRKEPVDMAGKADLPFAVVVLVVGVGITAWSAGCGNKAVEARRQATVAALARYPGNPQQSDDVRLAAVDRTKDKKIDVLNLTDRSVQSPT